MVDALQHFIGGLDGDPKWIWNEVCKMELTLCLSKKNETASAEAHGQGSVMVGQLDSEVH